MISPRTASIRIGGYVNLDLTMSQSVRLNMMNIDVKHSGVLKMDKTSLGPRPYMATMPVVLVGSNVNGKPNFMTVAWTEVACMEPPMIAIAINKARYTEKGIIENRTFSVNIPSAKNAVAMDHCGMVSGSKVDKSVFFESFYGKLKTAPLISDFPVNIECELRHTLELGSHNLHVGEIVDIHVANECLTAGAPDTSKIDPIVFSGQNYCHIGETIGKAFSIGKGFMK
jgi:flavin reductase (DIM6/NTAB) family NADH-FMN oxidoreductase RutF